MYNPLEVFKLKAFKSYFSFWQGVEENFFQSMNSGYQYNGVFLKNLYEPSFFFFNAFMYSVAEYYVYISRNWYFGFFLLKDLMGEGSLYSAVFNHMWFVEIFFYLFYTFIIIACCLQFTWEFVGNIFLNNLQKKIDWDFFFFNVGIKQVLYLDFINKIQDLIFFFPEPRCYLYGYHFLDFGGVSVALLSEKFLEYSPGFTDISKTRLYTGYNLVVEHLGLSLRKFFLLLANEREQYDWESVLYFIRTNGNAEIFCADYIKWLSVNIVTFTNMEGYLISFFFKSWALFPFFMFNVGESSMSLKSFFVFLFCFFGIMIAIFTFFFLLLKHAPIFNDFLAPFFLKGSYGLGLKRGSVFRSKARLLYNYFFEVFSLFSFFQHNFVLIDYSFSGYNIIETDLFFSLFDLIQENYWTDSSKNTKWIKLFNTTFELKNEFDVYLLNYWRHSAKAKVPSCQDFIIYNPNFSASLLRWKNMSSLSDLVAFIDARLHFYNYDLIVSDFFFFLSKSFLAFFFLLQSVGLFLFTNFSLKFNFINFFEGISLTLYGTEVAKLVSFIFFKLNSFYSFVFLHFGYNFIFLFCIFFFFIYFFFYSNWLFLRVKDTFFFFFFRLVLLTLFKIILDILTHSKGKLYFVSLLLFLFLFLVFLNFFGLVPYSFAITSYFSVTFFFSFSFFFTLFFIGVLMHGMRILGLFVPPGTPFLILPLLFVIEVVSYFARVFSLAIRLFANITAGHISLYIFSWFVVMLFDILGFSFLGFSLIIVLWVLESFISVLQAYVFVVLITLYLNEVLYLEH